MEWCAEERSLGHHIAAGALKEAARTLETEREWVEAKIRSLSWVSS
jgi:hypothetical protein